MGAVVSYEETLKDRERLRIINKLPPEMADVKLRRMDIKEDLVRFNRESAMHKMQESFDEVTHNPLDHWLGLAKKPPPPPPEYEDSPESHFMRKKMAANMDWEDPDKKAMRRTENCEDQSKHIIRMSCDVCKGYELVEVKKYPYAIKTHHMTVEELEINDLFDVHIVFKEKMAPWQFYSKAIRDWPLQPDYLDPELYNFIILQFKASREEVRAGQTIEQKIIDRYQFLKILLDLDMTTCTDKRIDLAWDPNGEDPISTKEEPLLLQFEARQVLNYYHELDGLDDNRAQRVDAKKIGRISMKDAFRIVMSSLISESTEYAPLQAPTSTYNCNNATAVAKMQKKRRAAADRLEAKAVGKLGRMRGPKLAMEQVVLKVGMKFDKMFKPVLDDIAFFEYSSANGERLMRRNTAWEFVAQMDSLDLIRPMKLVREIPTLRQDTTGWTSISSDPQKRAEFKGTSAALEEEEEQHYLIARWLRKTITRSTNRYKIKSAYEAASALDIATMKKRGRDTVTAAKGRKEAEQHKTGQQRKVEAIVYPALVLRQRRQEEDGVSDVTRAQGKAYKLHDLIDDLDQYDFD